MLLDLQYVFHLPNFRRKELSKVSLSDLDVAGRGHAATYSKVEMKTGGLKNLPHSPESDVYARGESDGNSGRAVGLRCVILVISQTGVSQYKPYLERTANRVELLAQTVLILCMVISTLFFTGDSGNGMTPANEARQSAAGAVFCVRTSLMHPPHAPVSHPVGAVLYGVAAGK